MKYEVIKDLRGFSSNYSVVYDGQIIGRLEYNNYSWFVS